MLQLIDIRKSFTTGDFTQVALDGISINFRDNEFVAILGPSGSGKTTTLNIVGGLDHYDSGDLIIDGVSTKEYKDRDWDTYRNNRIGFVFQSYNLIPHQTVLANVELALTLSGVSKSERRRRAKEALEKVGLGDHINKRPAQMSGGQMQRVAIARALINNPEILLADEPTGALDSKTSLQIMDLLTEIAKDRLVVMVTHNPDLAEQYATRTVTLADGRITGDTDPYEPAPEDFKVSAKKVRKASMSFFTALALSFNNLMTKKGRTIMTAFAGSIGIIGIAAILSLATGVNAYIDSIEEETLSEYPLQIADTGFDITTMITSSTDNSDSANGNSGKSGNTVGVSKMVENMVSSMGNNDLKSLKAYLESDKSNIYDYAKAIEYDYGITPLIYQADTSVKLHQANPDTTISQLYGSSMSSYMSSSSMMSSSFFSQLPNAESLYKDEYDVKAGHWPESSDEMVLVLSSTGRITDYLAYTLGLRDPDELTKAIKTFMSGDSELSIEEGADSYTYDELMGCSFKLVMPVDEYVYDEEYGTWLDKSDNTEYMTNLVNNGKTLKIVGIVQAKEDAKSSMLSTGLYYTQSLTDEIVDYAKSSDIVKQQLAHPDVDVFSGKTFLEEEEENSNKSIDMSTLFSFDESALANAFTVDENALSFDTSSLQIDASSIDMSSMKLDLSDMPEMDSETFQKAMSEGMKIDNTKIASTFSSVFTQYMTAVQKGTYPMSAEGFSKYMATTEAQTALGKGISSAFDTTGLSTNIQAAMQDYMTDTFQPYLQAKMTTAMSGVIEQISAKLQESLSSAMTGMMSNIGSAFSVDTSAFANAIQFNMDESTLSELITSMMTSDDASYDGNLSKLNYADYDSPSGIDIYPWNFDSKEKCIEVLDAYNDEMQNSGEDDKVISYTDIVGALMSSVTTIINAITTMLVAFVGISLVVSSIMIGIITYISVLERKKEIGILRSLGASKGNISQVFNAETIIIGLLAGLIGVGLTTIACVPVSILVHELVGPPNIMQLPLVDAVILVCISVFLTFIGGLIPAKSASRKDPVEALRSE